MSDNISEYEIREEQELEKFNAENRLRTFAEDKVHRDTVEANMSANLHSMTQLANVLEKENAKQSEQLRDYEAALEIIGQIIPESICTSEMELAMSKAARETLAKWKAK